MDRKYLLLFAVCAICFFSCGRDNVAPQSLIVGKWNLQQQHVVLDSNNVKVIDTILDASSTTYATAQFNSDGTYSSSSVYRPAVLLLLSKFQPTNQSNVGTYSYSANTFTVVSGLAGWFTFAIGSSAPPTGVSNSVQITQLDATHLNVHTENTITVTYDNGQHSYDESFDFYYTK